MRCWTNTKSYCTVIWKLLQSVRWQQLTILQFFSLYWQYLTVQWCKKMCIRCSVALFWKKLYLHAPISPFLYIYKEDKQLVKLSSHPPRSMLHNSVHSDEKSIYSSHTLGNPQHQLCYLVGKLQSNSISIWWKTEFLTQVLKKPNQRNTPNPPWKKPKKP